MGSEAETVTFSSGDLELYGRLRHSSDTGPTVVLVCGVGFHTFEYDSLATHLADAGINSLSFDFRGHGHSSGSCGRWDVDQLAEDAAHALDFVSARYPGPVVLYGNSLGAMWAILAGARDERVVGVVASNCPARIADFLLTRPRRVLFALAKAVAPIVPIRISVNHFYSYRQLIDDPAWIWTIEHDPLIADARRLSVTAYKSLLDDWDGETAVRELHKPLLLIQGRNDRLQPPAQSQRLYDAADEPKTYELVDTGHLPHIQDAEMVARLLTAWSSALIR